MRLDYLLFDFSDEEAGYCSFDSLASAVPAQLPALIHEVDAVLGWAHREFGSPSAGDDGWDFQLQACSDDDEPLEITFEVDTAGVSMKHGSSGRVTIALTLSGSSAFGAAFRDAFPDLSGEH